MKRIRATGYIEADVKVLIPVSKKADRGFGILEVDSDLDDAELAEAIKNIFEEVNFTNVEVQRISRSG